MVKPFPSYSDTAFTTRVSLSKQTASRQEAVDPAVCFMWVSQLLRGHLGHTLLWGSAGQNAQVPPNKAAALQRSSLKLNISGVFWTRNSTLAPWFSVADLCWMLVVFSSCGSEQREASSLLKLQ